jgi:acetyl-CoA carboxylase / biotin carboxylase 1
VDYSYNHCRKFLPWCSFLNSIPPVTVRIMQADIEPVSFLRSPKLTHASNGEGDDFEELSLEALSDRKSNASASICAPFENLESYVEACDGTRVIKKVLVANNGIGAVKCIRSIRRWAYENFADDRAVIFVCMATPEDLRSNAEHIRMADECLEVPGGANNNNYANVQLIVRLAQKSGADAVWAGWGHASENPILPESLAKVNITFIGPAAMPMRLLGDKIGSTIIAQSSNCPTISWNGDGLTVDTKDLESGIPPEVYAKANIVDVKACLECCGRVGFPVMIKASEGGGGKGVRMVQNMQQVPDAFRAVKGEVPGSPIFVMKLSSGARHLEVQLLADEYGQAIALSGRDCSIQRRFQKIIEEGPAVSPTPEVWTRMERAAVRLAKAVKYANAGTVEYLYKDGKFYFLELNPRLQVEHPVTEMITGVNLPAAQLCVAMGIPLHKIPDIIQLYSNHPGGADGRIPFDELQVKPNGHVIAARITAENPDSGFTPTSGSINELNFRNSRNVWGYFSLGSNGRVHEFADSQIGHVFSWGENREVARKGMVIALKELSIRGEIRTTVDYLVRLCEDSEFRKNIIDTTWLDKRIRNDALRSPRTKNAEYGVSMASPVIISIIGAACRAHQIKAKNITDFCESLDRGQTPSRELIKVSEEVELIYNDVKYTFNTSHHSADSFVISCNESWVVVAVKGLSDGGCLVQLGGKSFTVYLKGEADGLRMVVSGQTYVFTKEYDPTEVTAAMAGKLVRYMVPDGAQMSANSAFCEVEVMKMLMPLIVSEPGKISFVKPEGSVLEPGDLVATIQLDEPGKVRKAVPFDKKLPNLGSPYPEDGEYGRQPHHRFLDALKTLKNVLAGCIVPEPLLRKAFRDFDESLSDKLLPVYEFSDCLSVLTGRIPSSLESSLRALAKEYDVGGTFEGGDFPVRTVNDIIKNSLVSLPERDADALKVQLKPILDILETFKDGIDGNRELVVASFVQEYLDVEEHFASKLPYAELVMTLRQSHLNDIPHVYAAAVSHESCQAKSDLLIEMLNRANTLSRLQGLSKEDRKQARKTSKLLSSLAVLSSLSISGLNTYASVTLTARKILIRYFLPSLQERKTEVREVIEKCVPTPSSEVSREDNDARGELMASLVNTSQPIFKTMAQFWEDGSPYTGSASTAMEAYVRRAYRAYSILSVIAGSGISGFPYIRFIFSQQLDPSAPAKLAPTLHKSDSFGSLSLARLMKSKGDTIEKPIERCGVFCVLQSLKSMIKHFRDIVCLVKPPKIEISGDEPPNTVHIVLYDESLGGEFETEAGVSNAENAFIARVEGLIEEHVDAVRSMKIRRISVILQYAPRVGRNDLPREGPDAGIYTFRMSKSKKEKFEEDFVVRNIEPTEAHKLELSRLSNYSIRPALSQNRAVHVYAASGLGSDGVSSTRFFVRSIVQNMRGIPTFYYSGSKRVQLDAYPGPEARFVECLDALEVATADLSNPSEIYGNHVFLNCVESILIRPEYFEDIIGSVYRRYYDRIRRLRVSQVEFRLLARVDEFSPIVPIRLLVADPTGYTPIVEMYAETKDAGTKKMILTSLPSKGPVVKGSLDGENVFLPYPLFDQLSIKRQKAHNISGTCYCYDFIDIFRQGIQEIWIQNGMQVFEKSKLLRAVEIVLNFDKTNPETQEPLLEFLERPPGQNDIGMVAWVLHLNTPEYNELTNQSRKIVVIANDITFKVGSFGTREDKLFEIASEYARQNGLPRIFLAANSGARIGMAEEVKETYQVAWVDNSDPKKGFEYIYLRSEDYKRLSAMGSVKAKQIVVQTSSGEDEERFVITDIIGSSPDLGVENLRGSGTIAGVTSRAYDDIFTLTFVTGRCVGIGAYLVRLGQRTIQKEVDAPILLTGYNAINKLLGTPVYSSNQQLGGPGIMYTNGVSHLTVKNDLDGIHAILRWLSYVPSVSGGLLPILQQDMNKDSPDRNVEILPTKTPMDPRVMLTGKFTNRESHVEEQFLAGFFDRDSWMETMGGWAKTVITGRARLGGIPMGVIVPESRTVEHTIPADPASPQSREEKIKQPGGVWFPDSSHKTAQAIDDFNREGLPLIIFGNWRGFSGGQRDMYEEVLKFGAKIVDALVKYKQPVFVYLPPYATLRGGAWAVLDSTINPDMMEMYADPKARGGVLEAAGAVSIKYRKPQLLQKQRQLDPLLKRFNAELESATLAENIADIKQKVERREASNMASYVQVATHFADLHDTPGRMASKKCIAGVVEWRRSRSFFHWRLRRKLAENSLIHHITSTTGISSFKKVSELLKIWFVRSAKRLVASPRLISNWRNYASGVSAAGVPDNPGLRSSPINDGAGDELLWADDRKILNWMSSSESNIDEEVNRLREIHVIDSIIKHSRENRPAVLKAMLKLIDDLDESEKDRLHNVLGGK